MATGAGLIWRRELNCYACPGCDELIPVPRRAVLHAGRKAVPIEGHPENRLLWMELQTLDHRPCTEYHDRRLAQAARKFGRGLRRLSRSASANARRGGSIERNAQRAG